jgi:hypothetical protein
LICKKNSDGTPASGISSLSLVALCCYPEWMQPASSPTAEGFRTAFRQPLFTAAEIVWRWSVGGSAIAILFIGLYEFLNTLPVSKMELFFLRTRQPYLVGQAIAHILHGSLNRAVGCALLAALSLGLLWMIAASLGRMVIVRNLLDHFRKSSSVGILADVRPDRKSELATNSSGNFRSAFPALFRLNFLRAVLVISVIVGVIGAAIVAGLLSPDSGAPAGLAFLFFASLAVLLCLIGWALNWFLSMATLFSVRDNEDALGSVAAAVSLCRERIGTVLAVSFWTGLAHIAAFVAATIIVSIPIGLAGLLPWRLVTFFVVVVTLAYFAAADWFYIARLAGYVFISDLPEAFPPRPIAPTLTPSYGESRPTPPLQNTIDRDELILSDVPNFVKEN